MSETPVNDSACVGLWTYSSYRATLRKDGQFFAVVSPNGNDALHPNDAVRLIETLQRGEKATELQRELNAAKQELELARKSVEDLRAIILSTEMPTEKWLPGWKSLAAYDKFKEVHK